MFPFTLQQLRILKAVAAEKNFTKAAELLYISQPSLSKQIKILEKNLQISLIIRKKHKIYLTETGKIFLQYSERILALCEESCRALIDLKNIERGELTIGASQAIGTNLLPRILALFNQNYPQINLKVQINSTRFITKSIINREIDIAIICNEIPTKLKKNLIIKSFVEDEFTLILSKFHPFAIKKRITKKDLYDLNFITLNSNSVIKKFMDNILSQNHIEIKQLKIIMQLNSLEGIKTAVSLGLGVAFISSAIIKKEIALKKIAILRIENIQINRVLTIICHPESYKSKAFKIFYGELSKLKYNI
uniref:Probable RuBisCO transcriptional regulator n=1 Tax=Climaconeis cf. scalaris TaxID=2846828 RepID=A0A8F8SPP3_9STRA|nr:rubisco operon transcription regulator [Climaconeis cf. scalaris]QYB19389.1 rubisco operon transcription regulator [Climaconeis cf. scalaris]